ncbi:glycosyltransferase family 2 protein [Alteromonas halophila]|uniref:Glycosyltransferase 2-like domain-containing protein n=1 Tax=Alteromonas halophila TaxID=516698 RepID=A0A918JN79_9ALTE|nr:glycosyltransferase family 2 protein [Alteromonas halophila]GGW85190.1 hypothetical protein GCM10007391_18850 [Alteromonas halophila]
MSVSVIFTTYNSPDWLEKTLWGLYYQSVQDFEIVVADDGSGEETRARITQFIKQSGRHVTHVWQPDDGFQKTRILNKAIKQSSGDYLIFTDGDCICRSDFVATHLHYRAPGYILSGGYFKLPMQTSKLITRSDIANGNAFNLEWLLSHGLKKTHKTMKLTASGWWARALNAVTPAKATWNGHNASGWRCDIIAANGFDERMQYGGEDREFGERLFNQGIKARQIRYSAVCVHLDHARGYATAQARSENNAIRAHTKLHRMTQTPFGLEKLG